MIKNIFLLLVSFTFITEYTSAQTYVRVDDYRSLKIVAHGEKEKVKNFILTNELDSIRNYFDLSYIIPDAPLDKVIPFFNNRERAFVNFLINDKTQLRRDIENDRHYFSSELYLDPSGHLAISDLTQNMLDYWITFASERVSSSIPSDDQEELLLLYLKRATNDLVGFPYFTVFSQDSINIAARRIALLLDPVDLRRDFIINHIMYVEEYAGKGYGISLSPIGYTSFNSDLANVFSNSYSLSFDLDLRYRQLLFNLGLSYRYSDLKKDVTREDLLWQNDGTAFITGLTGSLGYSVLNTRRLTLTPMAGLNSMRITYSFEDSTYSDNAENFINPHIAVLADFKLLKNRKSKLNSSNISSLEPDQSSYFFIRFYAGHFPNGFSNAFGESGSVTHLSLGVGYYFGKTRLRKRL